jgi:tetratricopeptide (TPR) repeat protein
MSKRSHQIEAFFQQGRRLHDQGRLTEAEQVFRQILAAEPAHAESLHRLGVIALQLGHPEPALGLIDQAIGHKRLTAVFHLHRAHALLALGRPADALAAGREAVRLKRALGEASLVVGHALSDLGRPDEALSAYREALRLEPRLPDLHNAMGLALREAHRPTEAIATFQEALRRTPGDPLVSGNLAGMLKDTGALPAAEAIYRDLLRRNPNDARTHFDLAMLLFLAERFEEAWPEWDWRFRADASLAMPFPQPEWRGESLGGRTLLVHAEQGMGDVLQFCRYLDRLPKDGRIVLQVHRPLARLLTGRPGIDQVAALGDPLPAYDCRVPIMSLPPALGATGLADAEMAAPYMTANATDAARWRVRLAELPGLKVGLVWAGNPERMRMDRRRSVPVSMLAPLAGIQGVSLISLQKGPAAADLAAAPFAGAVFDPGEALGDFADTAALVDALDLVIAVDTAVVHLAGAMGKPVWLLNRSDTCWRWGVGRTDCVWYPSLRQFRQSRSGDWAGVVGQVAIALRERAGLT